MPLHRRLLLLLCLLRECVGRGRGSLEDGSALLQVALLEPELAEPLAQPDSRAEGAAPRNGTADWGPRPVTLATMRSIKPVEKRMREYRLKDGTSIYGYEKSEDTFISGSLAKGRLWKSRESSEICRFFQSVDGSADFLDVGANIGTWTIPVASCLRSLGKGGRVLAVEGLQPIVEHLEVSAVVNNLGNIDVYNYAVGDVNATANETVNQTDMQATMYLDPKNKGASSILEGGKDTTPMNVNLTSLDAILANGDAKIFGMKINVEGYEGHVLRGAKQLLQKNPPCVLHIFLNNKLLKKAKMTVKEVMQMLYDAGYNATVPKYEPSSVADLFAQRNLSKCKRRFREVRNHSNDTLLPDDGQPSAAHEALFYLEDGASQAVELVLPSAEQANASEEELPPALVPRPTSAEAMKAVDIERMVEYRLKGGLVIYGYDVEEDKFISGMLDKGRLWRSRESDELCRYFRDVHGRADFLDVGANIGTWTVPLARCLQSVGLDGRVIAVEGLPFVTEHLAASVTQNDVMDNVDLYNYTVGDVRLFADGTVNATMWMDPDNMGGSSLVVKAEEATAVPTNLTSLDRILSRSDARVFAMKMDIEGYEGHALSGARRFLARQPPCIINIDLNKQSLSKAGMDMDAVVDFLISAGYDFPADNRGQVRGFYFQRDIDKCRERFREDRVPHPRQDYKQDGEHAAETQLWQSRGSGPATSREVLHLQPLALAAADDADGEDANATDDGPTPLAPAALDAVDSRGMTEYRMRDGMIIYGFEKREDTFISGMLAKGRLWKSKESDEMCRYFREVQGRADFVDVGANVGTWTVPMAWCLQSMGFDGRVIAVEGMPLIAEHLAASVTHNGLQDCVDVYNYTVGDVHAGTDGAANAEATQVTMYLDPTNKGGSSVVTQADGATAIATNLTSLDRILSRSDARVFGMKISIEGYEGQALSGARRLLARRPPCILGLELNRKYLTQAGVELREVIEFLRSAGYDLPSADRAPSSVKGLYLQKDFDSCRARFREDRVPHPNDKRAAWLQGRGEVPHPHQFHTQASAQEDAEHSAATSQLWQGRRSGPAADREALRLPTFRVPPLALADAEGGDANATDGGPTPLAPAALSAVDARDMPGYRMKDGLIIYGFEKSEDTFISGMLAKGRLWRSRESDEMCRYFREVQGRADFMDVGANIGTWTVPMARCLQSVGMDGRVIAVEGVPLIAEHLAASVAHNGLQDNVDVYNYTVGDVPLGADGAANATQVTMYLDPTNKGGSSVVNQAEGATAIATNLTSLDRILSRSNATVFGMKMDIEGYEGQALSGARRLLARRPPCILNIEFNKKYLTQAGVDMLELIEFLRSAGYDIPAADRAPSTFKGLYLQKDFDSCRARFLEDRVPHPRQFAVPQDDGRSAEAELWQSRGGREARVRGSREAHRSSLAVDREALQVHPLVLMADVSDTDANTTDEQLPPALVPRPLTPEVVRSVNSAEEDMVEYRMKDGLAIIGFDQDEDTFISSMLAKGRLWRSRESDEMCRHFRDIRGPADFLDVGAHVGTWAVPMARCLQAAGMGGRVLAVEGAPRAVERLAASVARNSLEESVDIYNYSVGDVRPDAPNSADGNATNLTIFVDPINRGGSSAVVVADGAMPVTTKLTSLDRILAASDADVFGMKMDVEGYEGHALSGARRLLVQRPPCILNIELNKRFLSKAGVEMEDVLAFLRHTGYDVPETDRAPSNTKGLFFQKDFESCRARFGEASAQLTDKDLEGTSDVGHASFTASSSKRSSTRASEPEPVGLVDIGYVHDPQPVEMGTVLRSAKLKPSHSADFSMRDGMVIAGFDTSEDSFISTSLARGSLWRSKESAEVCKIFNHLRGRADFLDVGAHVGTWTVPLAHCLHQLGKGGRVVAVEGAEPIAERLEASVALNGLENMVDIYNYVVGDGNVTADVIANETTSEVKMYLDPSNKGGSSLVTRADNAEEITSPITTLDAILSRSSARIFGMKMDIEGYEGRALKGAKLLLANPPCILNIELNKKFLSKAGTSLRSVLDLLRNAGYDVPDDDREPSNVRELYFQRDFELCQARFDEDGLNSSDTSSTFVRHTIQPRYHRAKSNVPEPLRMIDIGYIHDPHPASVEAMRNITPAEKGMVEYTMKDGLSIYGYNKSEDTFVSGMLSKGRLWEGRSSRDFCDQFQKVKGRADFLDVGANIGTWSVPIARCILSQGLGGKVIAIEGMKPIAEYLEASVVRNNLTDTIDVYNYCVGDGYAVASESESQTTETTNHTRGTLAMNLDPTNKGGSSIVNSAENGTSVLALMTTLDSILANYNNATIFGMKMDIEGYEGHALKGALQLLAEPPCVISIELNRKFLTKAGTPLEDVVAMLSDAGFDMPEYDKWPALSSAMYYQKDFDACVARFDQR